MKRSIKHFKSVVFIVRQTPVLAYFPFATPWKCQSLFSTCFPRCLSWLPTIDMALKCVEFSLCFDGKKTSIKDQRTITTYNTSWYDSCTIPHRKKDCDWCTKTLKPGSHLCDNHNTSYISISTRKKEHVSFFLCLCLCLCHLCYAYRTSVNQAQHNSQKHYKIFKTRLLNVLCIGTNIVKIWLSMCLIDCVRFARHCGKMYSRHLFS